MNDKVTMMKMKIKIDDDVIGVIIVVSILALTNFTLMIYIVFN